MSAGASTVSSTTATGINYFKTGEDPPLKDDSEYPDWLWTIAEPPLSLFTLERNYSQEDAITDENFQEASCMAFLFRADSALFPLSCKTAEQGGPMQFSVIMLLRGVMSLQMARLVKLRNVRGIKDLNELKAKK